LGAHERGGGDLNANPGSIQKERQKWETIDRKNNQNKTALPKFFGGPKENLTTESQAVFTGVTHAKHRKGHLQGYKGGRSLGSDMLWAKPKGRKSRTHQKGRAREKPTNTGWRDRAMGRTGKGGNSNLKKGKSKSNLWESCG